ncbi:MAG: hypothetical protein R3C68_17760 [Myxococcota bacterium]
MRPVLLLVLLSLCVGGYVYQRMMLRALPSYGALVDGRSQGVFHIHSEASHDSSLSLDEITLAAVQVGLSFVVVTDHNKQLAEPVTRNGVLVISAAELSTPFGHVISLGSRQLVSQTDRQLSSIHAAVREVGGVPVLAHPSDVKNPWHGPTTLIGGVEIANIAASVRRHRSFLYFGLLPAVMAWGQNPQLALAQLYDRDVQALRLWDAAEDPGLFGICGVDAHGHIETSNNLRMWKLVLARPNMESPLRADTVLRDLRQGRFYCQAGLLKGESQFTFFAETVGPGGTVGMGDFAPEKISALVVKHRGIQPGGSTLVLLRNGQEVLRTRETTLHYPRPVPGVYRVEVLASLAEVFKGVRTVPVIYSNRIAGLDETSPFAEERVPWASPGAERFDGI